MIFTEASTNTFAIMFSMPTIGLQTSRGNRALPNDTMTSADSWEDRFKRTRPSCSSRTKEHGCANPKRRSSRYRPCLRGPRPPVRSLRFLTPIPNLRAERTIRVDHTVNERLSIFGRYNEAPSSTAARTNTLSEVAATDIGTRTVTVGATLVLSPLMANNFRANYSTQSASGVTSLDSFGGAVPPSLSVLGPNLLNPGSFDLEFGTLDTGFYSTGPEAKNRSTQLNFADDFTLSHGTHRWKFGGDYRAIYLNLSPSPALEYIVSSVSNFLATSEADYGIYGLNTKPTKFLFQATGLYGQDTWKINSRLTLVYGLRWELNPAPSGRGATTLAAWQNVNNPAAIAPAPAGSSLWSTTYSNFAPRVGVAYSLTSNGSLVLRAGAGIFYDLGTDAAGFLGATFPNSASQCCPTASLPLADATPYVPIISLLPPYPVDTAGLPPTF